MLDYDYMKWKEVDRDRTLYLLGLNWTADFSWSKILSSDWSVSLKLCSDWLGELLTDEFQLLWHTQTQTDRQTDIVDCWTATFAVKNRLAVGKNWFKPLFTLYYPNMSIHGLV